MKRLLLIPTVLLVLLALGLADTAQGFERTLMGAIAHRRAQTYAWHGDYYSPAWGMPTALVVPPTVQSQTQWGWGVGNTRVIGIPHQFDPGYPGYGIYDRSMFRPTPPWPSDTTQFGVYYIRGPW
ncbi:MAG: hypothetical protein ABIK89_19670 [Planctomycetota bacterium]